VALGERLQDVRGQVGGMDAGQPAVALADRRSHRFDDDRSGAHAALRRRESLNMSGNLLDMIRKSSI
jgi:hypothetical protein